MLMKVLYLICSLQWWQPMQKPCPLKFTGSRSFPPLQCRKPLQISFTQVNSFSSYFLIREVEVVFEFHTIFIRYILSPNIISKKKNSTIWNDFVTKAIVFKHWLVCYSNTSLILFLIILLLNEIYVNLLNMWVLFLNQY